MKQSTTPANLWVTFLMSDRYADLGLLFLRLFAGGMMLRHGLAKVANYSTLQEQFPDPLGIGAGASLLLIMLAEVGCSVLIAAGFLTRFALIPLAFGMITAAFLTAPQVTMASAEMPLIYLGIYLFLLLAGPGRYSVDALLTKR